MSATIIDGTLVAEKIKNEVRNDVQNWVARGNRPPKLQVLLVGSDPASQSYVNAKTRDCKEVGIESETMILPDTVSQEEVCSVIRSFNEDETVDGILVQLPLPDHISQLAIIESIDHRKDVDGFHPMNIGRLAIDQPAFKPCTPSGIMELFKFYSIPLKGKHAVVVGASNIVGSPMAVMLSRENKTGKATTTICHKYTRDLTSHTINADILIVAVGVPSLIKSEMVKEGVVIIDVGINRLGDESLPRGYKLVGDTDFKEIVKKASYITPVPGGVGPMTRAMLMKNTLLAAKKSLYPNK
jgi:methylenetetrahydrofolate dehydrogenase (NADP+)/methenyltetrahydrofolate cyclohydrolase